MNTLLCNNHILQNKKSQKQLFTKNKLKDGRIGRAGNSRILKFENQFVSAAAVFNFLAEISLCMRSPPLNFAFETALFANLIQTEIAPTPRQALSHNRKSFLGQGMQLLSNIQQAIIQNSETLQYIQPTIKLAFWPTAHRAKCAQAQNTNMTCHKSARDLKTHS